MKTFIVGAIMVLGIEGAQAEPTTVYFNGTVGTCISLPCEDLGFGLIPPGRPFVGQFTYDTFNPFPDDWGGFAGEVENFTVQFENLTLTATDAELKIQPFDKERQFVAVVGLIPNGFMTVGITSTELPARTDLLNPQGITWDCVQWGTCGMQIRIHSQPFSNSTLQFPTAVSAYYSATDGSNGTFQFTPVPTVLPSARPSGSGRVRR